MERLSAEQGSRSHPPLDQQRPSYQHSWIATPEAPHVTNESRMPRCSSSGTKSSRWLERLRTRMATLDNFQMELLRVALQPSYVNEVYLLSSSQKALSPILEAICNTSWPFQLQSPSLTCFISSTTLMLCTPGSRFWTSRTLTRLRHRSCSVYSRLQTVLA
jgi:hypothetical protein